MNTIEIEKMIYSLSDTVKELKWFVFLVSFAMGIICKIVFSEIYKILINKRNLTIGTSCKGRITKISEKIIFKDFATEDDIKKDDWETTPYLHKIQIVAHYIVRYHKNDEYSLFTKVKDFPATEKIKEILKNMFKDKDEYETILEMKLAHLMLIADGVYIEDSSCEMLQSPKKYYQWILEHSQPKTHK